jgi:uncharacterized membrane protein
MIEAAVGYRDDAEDGNQNWVSEGWWRIQPGQCARVYGKPLSQRFYFYFAHALSSSVKDAPPTQWGGRFVLCTETKAFRITGDSDCVARNFQATGFQELDVGGSSRDYTLDFRDASSR